jgi:hypothetical protein
MNPRPLRSLRLTALSLALLACAGPRPAAAEGARSGAYTLEVVDEAGAPLRTFSFRGRTYVLGERGQRYLLRIRNGSARRIEVVASVDGRDVVDGTPAAWAKRGYLVEAYGEVTVDGFRLSRAEVAAFRFAPVADSYAARMGDALDVGVIGVAVFPEAQRRPIEVPSPRWPPPDDARGQGSVGRSEEEARRDAGAARKAAPSDALSDAQGPAASSSSPAERRERPGLGTEFGERHDSQVQEREFERASARPAAGLAVRYDDRRGLLALGVEVDGPRWSRRDERRLRDTAEPFRRDPRYAEPPPGR